MKRHGKLRTMYEAMIFWLIVILTFGGSGVLAQMRIVDQGMGAAAANGWPLRICDTSGHCVTMILVGANYAVPVTVTSGSVTITGTQTVTGTVQANAGTGTFNMTCISGCGGAATFSDASAFTFGTTPVGNIGAVVDDVATNTVAENSAGAPRMSSTRILLVSPQGTTTVAGTLTGITGTVTSTPSGTTTITGTVSATSGTINSIPAITQTSGTVNSATISQMPSVSVTSGTIGSITMPSLTVTSGTIGSITMPSLTVTSGTIGQITITSGTISQLTTGTVQANAGTGTLGVDVAKVLGAALTTANPLIDGGRASTDTTASVADGVARAFRLDKYGDLVIVAAPQDLQSSARAILTATTASSMFSAPGANYKYAITLLSVCNLAGTIAGQVDITDSSGTLYSFPWTQTATTAGEQRCYVVNLGSGDPIFSAANSTISAKASVANGTGFAVNVALHKTGT